MFLTSGVYGVPVFFLMSGFFTSLKILRLVLLYFPALCLAFMLDEKYYSGSGDVWGYISMTGLFYPKDKILEWAYDLSMAPCWSLVADFHGNIHSML
mmetsp:Transcript_15746/g.38834  ORF Transcript_15746/g.38834 Transcript_15746/m.38834 type:complete len:97 (-) Transcript_15746:6-296(-)